MTSFESIIGLLHPQVTVSASLDQHASAMRMDRSYAWARYQLTYALTEARRAVNAPSALGAQRLTSIVNDVH